MQITTHHTIHLADYYTHTIHLADYYTHTIHLADHYTHTIHLADYYAPHNPPCRLLHTTQSTLQITTHHTFIAERKSEVAVTTPS